MGKIGLFGGTFDPPHTGHTALAHAVLKRFSLDKIIFIPAGNPPHKTDKRVTDKHHRFEMLSIAIKNNPSFLLSDFEVKNDSPNYSYITIEHFKKAYPDDEIFFVVGEDSYRDFPLWKNYPEILSLCTYIVVNRPNVENDDYFLKYRELSPKHSAMFLDDFSHDISSTELRKKLFAGQRCEKYLPHGVFEYIQKNKLYSKESL